MERVKSQNMIYRKMKFGRKRTKKRKKPNAKRHQQHPTASNDNNNHYTETHQRQMLIYLYAVREWLVSSGDNKIGTHINKNTHITQYVYTHSILVLCLDYFSFQLPML